VGAALAVEAGAVLGFIISFILFLRNWRAHG
jgi:hypothetical protein